MCTMAFRTVGSGPDVQVMYATDGAFDWAIAAVPKWTQPRNTTPKIRIPVWRKFIAFCTLSVRIHALSEPTLQSTTTETMGEKRQLSVNRMYSPVHDAPT